MRGLLVLACALLGASCQGRILPNDAGPDAGSDDAPDRDIGREAGRDAVPDARLDSPIADVGTDAPPPWSPVCPLDQPAEGASCTREGLQCEYGEADFYVGCNTVLGCISGKWADAGYESMFGCSPEVPNPSSCPADYSDLMAPDAGTCVDNLLCAYPEGVCQCLTAFMGVAWYCPGNDCPSPRARLGASCSTSGQDCPYYPCLWDEICTDGYWQGLNDACAEG